MISERKTPKIIVRFRYWVILLNIFTMLGIVATYYFNRVYANEFETAFVFNEPINMRGVIMLDLSYYARKLELYAR